jgi:hypothetical protein
VSRRCFFAGDGPCDGRLIRAHLIPQQLLKREHAPRRYLADPRGWVLVCGGPMGLSGHHGMFDMSRTVRVPRWKLPAEVEEMAAELGLGWWLDRTYGERPVVKVVWLTPPEAMEKYGL